MLPIIMPSTASTSSRVTTTIAGETKSATTPYLQGNPLAMLMAVLMLEQVRGWREVRLLLRVSKEAPCTALQRSAKGHT